MTELVPLQAVPLPDKVLARARTCPRCEAPATPSLAIQSCVYCKKPFILVAGERLDPAVTPKARPPSGVSVKMKYADAVLRHTVTVDDEGVTDAELDPVTGMIPVSKRLIPFKDIVTVGLYRRVDWATLAVLVLLYFGPVVLPLIIGTFYVPLLATISLPALALFVLGLKKTIGIGMQRMRIVSATDALVVRFDSPMWKRKKFLAALVEGMGVGALPWK